MMQKVKRTKNISERGSTTFEAVAAILILCFILFAMLQIYIWCINGQFCQYASFYAAKSMALGYRHNLVARAGRVAAIAISGKKDGIMSDDENAALAYMNYGDGSGVHYSYWHQQSPGDPFLLVSGRYINDNVHGRVKVKNMPLLEEGIFKAFVTLEKNPEPYGETVSRNYSNIYLEE